MIDERSRYVDHLHRPRQKKNLGSKKEGDQIE